MIGLRFTFDLGRYHGTPWGAHVNEGATEWPPSPWRVLRALYAASRADAVAEDRRGALDEALRGLLRAPRARYRLPASLPAHTRHYLPLQERGKTALVLDAFRAVARDDPLELWFDVELDAEPRRALGAVAQQVGYLGRSESLCSGELAPSPPQRWDSEPVPDAGAVAPGQEVVELLCPQPAASLAVLEADVGSMKKDRLRRPAGTERVSYLVHAASAPIPHAPAIRRPTTLLFRVDSPSRPGLTEAVTVTDALRAAAQRQYGGGVEGLTSSVLSGHDDLGKRRDQHRHAHYLAWPDDRSPRVDHVGVWAPEGFDAPASAALASITRLASHLLREPLELGLTAVGDRDSLRLPWLFGPSERWETVTPFTLVRHPKRRGGRLVDGPEEQVRRELALRGMAAPADVEIVRGRWHEFRRARASRSALGAPPAFGVRLRFDQAVAGPIAIGALSHFGLGLFRAH